ncbi:hypothetical protein HZ994_07045 [Akkermansiaceae bacterium]|nr:hypothetical protein HZ994_07045 [Akkermansiaceae bacterium]
MLLHRFAAAGAAIQYQIMHQMNAEEVLAHDVAPRGDDPEWIEELPADITENLIMTLYYGHFMCNVFHQDYIFKKGTETEVVKTVMEQRLEAKGAKLPAEHNISHIFKAEPALREFYLELDPTHIFNPGIGKRRKHGYSTRSTPLAKDPKNFG